MIISNFGKFAHTKYSLPSSMDVNQICEPKVRMIIHFLQEIFVMKESWMLISHKYLGVKQTRVNEFCFV